jgi:putative transposon-encoded protein
MDLSSLDMPSSPFLCVTSYFFESEIIDGKNLFLYKGIDAIPQFLTLRLCITKDVVETDEITVRNIQAYMERVVTKFGSGAKVDCPKEFLGKRASLIIEKDEE